ncbi:hypothetical protein ACWC3Y_10930 [Streptomyces sp. NPDC001296]
MTAQPEADELRIRSILRNRGVGPDAVTPAAVPPKPAARPRDWLDDILDETPEPEPEPEEKPAAPEPRQRRRSRPAEQPATEADEAPHRGSRLRPAVPRLSLLDAVDGIRPRVRWLIYHGTAAAAGWPLGLTRWATHTASWYAQGHWASTSAWVLYGLGLCAISLYRRSRRWAWPAAWAAAIPASSVTVGVLLYGTAT